MFSILKEIVLTNIIQNNNSTKILSKYNVISCDIEIDIDMKNIMDYKNFTHETKILQELYLRCIFSIGKYDTFESYIEKYSNEYKQILRKYKKSMSFVISDWAQRGEFW
jgi:hypothetical protein